MRLPTVLMGGLMLAHLPFIAAHAEDLTGDPDAGRKKSVQCQTCHGKDGLAKIPIAPNIGGEPAPYLAAQLKAFREGTREHEMMTVVAKGLDDQTIADLAAWYASHEAAGVLPVDVTSENAPEACVSCHGENGISVVEDAPHLAGESVLYIETQLKAFRSGKRKHETMSEIASELGDDDIRAFANWYASIKLTITDAKN